MFIIMFVVTVSSVYMHMSNLIKLHTLNIFSVGEIRNPTKRKAFMHQH